jgi:hypothetical protein
MVTTGQQISELQAGVDDKLSAVNERLDSIMLSLRNIVDPSQAIAALKQDLHKQCDTILQVLAGFESPSNPADVSNWLANLVLLPGHTTTLPRGVQQLPAHVRVPHMIAGQGMRDTLLDGRGGRGTGHNLALNRGVVCASAPLTIQDIGFVNGGGVDGVSNAEAGLHILANVNGTVYVLRCAFDACENGIYTSNLLLPKAKLVVESCVFGEHRSNGTADGSSSDIKIRARVATIKDCLFYGNQMGDTIVSFTEELVLTNNVIARSDGSWLKLPQFGRTVSSDNVYVTLPTATATDAIAHVEQNNGSFISTRDRFYFSRPEEDIWLNCPSQFVDTSVFWVGKPGAKPPKVKVRGPYKLSKDKNPFLLSAANRVDHLPELKSLRA